MPADQLNSDSDNAKTALLDALELQYVAFKTAINQLFDLVAKANERASVYEQRAELFLRALNLATAENAELKSTIAKLVEKEIIS